MLKHPRHVQILLMQEGAGRFDICTGNDWAGAEGQKKNMCRVSSPRKPFFAELIINATCSPVLLLGGSKHFSATKCRLVREFVSQHRLLRSTQHEPTPRCRQNRTHSEIHNVATRQMFTIETVVRNFFGTEKSCQSCHQAFAWDTTTWLRCPPRNVISFSTCNVALFVLARGR